MSKKNLWGKVAYFLREREKFNQVQFERNIYERSVRAGAESLAFPRLYLINN